MLTTMLSSVNNNTTLIDLDHISGNKDILLHSNDNNSLNDSMFHSSINNNNNNNNNSSSNNNNNSNNWFDPLDNIITPTSMSTTSSTSLESPLTFQDQSSNSISTTSTSNFQPNNYVNFTNPMPLPLPKHTPFQTLKFEKSTQRDNKLKIKKESLMDGTIPITTKKRRSGNRKRLTQHQKEAHNKIEKRYRININTKIAKLQQIIPWVASEDTAFEVSDTLRRVSLPSMDSDSVSNTAATKLNKSMILEKAVDYILYLQNNEHLYELEVQRLRNELDSLKNGRTQSN